jgi:hypothetical protein
MRAAAPDSASPALVALREYLGSLEPDEIDAGRLMTFLVPAWPTIDGAHEDAMAAHKLARLERPRWNPPLLTFNIERHGGTVLGSTRAELECWTVDVVRGEAAATMVGYRQLTPAQPRFDVKVPVRELVAAMRAGSDDPRLKRTKEGGVEVLTGEILPLASKQTTNGRRKRFYELLDAELAGEWVRSGSTYRHEPAC